MFSWGVTCAMRSRSFVGGLGGAGGEDELVVEEAWRV